MQEFRQFLTVNEFKELTQQVTRTHMKSREIAFVLKFVAAERSERGEKSETRRRKPRKSGGEDRAGIDSSILPPSIRGDDSGSGESGGALETVD